MFNKGKEAFSCKKSDSLSIQVPADSIDDNLEDYFKGSLISGILPSFRP